MFSLPLHLAALPTTPYNTDVELHDNDPDATGVFKHIELEILTGCDLACFGCDRFSDVTNAPNMTLAQVKNFVDESLDLNWSWERIRLLGGEPTLHPQLHEMALELVRYRSYYPHVFLQLLSNGRGKLEQHRLWLLEHHIDPHVEGKQPGVQPKWFVNTRLAPVDNDPTVGELPPCGIFGIRGCGIGLTRNGYFLDGAGASAAKIAGLDVGVMTLQEVTWNRMQEQAKVLCRICGHWNPLDGRIVTKKVTETGMVTGGYWQQKIAAYKQQKPPMRVYGQC